MPASVIVNVPTDVVVPATTTLYVDASLQVIDEAGGMWAHGIATEWSTELQDPREDIYTLDDGQPVNAPR